MESPVTTQRMFDNRALCRLIIPLVIESALAQAVGIIDTMMISSAGETAVSGVSLVDGINSLLIYLFSALNTGGAVVAAQYLGGRSEREARDSGRQLLLLSLSLSMAILLVLLLTRRWLLATLFGSVEPAVMEAANTYFFWSMLSYPFVALYNSGAALFRTEGNSKISMYSSLVMNVLNVGGNALLLYGAKMGVAGVAIATLISRAVAMVIVLVLLRRKNHTLYVDVREGFRVHWPTMHRILRIAVPNSIESAMFHLGRLLVVRIIADFGTVEIAANAVANSLAGVSMIPGTAVNLATTTVTGQCVGAGDFEQVRYYARKMLRINFTLMSITNISMLVALPLLLGFFDLSGPTLALANLLMWIYYVASMLIWPLAFTIPNVLRAANDVAFTMVASLLSMGVFRVLLSVVLAEWFHLGALGVWSAMIVDWVVRTICFVGRYRSRRWCEEHTRRLRFTLWHRRREEDTRLK